MQGKSHILRGVLLRLRRTATLAEVRKSRRERPRFQGRASNATPSPTRMVPHHRTPVMGSCNSHFAPRVARTKCSAVAGTIKLTSAQESTTKNVPKSAIINSRPSRTDLLHALREVNITQGTTEDEDR